MVCRSDIGTVKDNSTASRPGAGLFFEQPDKCQAMLFNADRQLPPDASLRKMRCAGHAQGAEQAGIASVALGGCMTHAQASAWINGYIAEQRTELRAMGAGHRDIEAWDWACRIMFMLKVRKAIMY
jgi:hypothetical protein